MPLLAVLLAGCGGAVETTGVEPERPVVAARGTPRPEISLAVTAVQFEGSAVVGPGAESRSNQLVVVIDNRGRRRVDARVQVRLTGDDPADMLAELTRDAGTVAAGESRVVRFDIPARIPDRSCYTLSVQVLTGGEVTETATQGARTYRVCPGR